MDDPKSMKITEQCVWGNFVQSSSMELRNVFGVEEGHGEPESNKKEALFSLID